MNVNQTSAVVVSLNAIGHGGVYVIGILKF